MASTMEVYFDESGTSADSPFVCASTYLFEQKNAQSMTQEWAVMLNKYQIPYVHMVELASAEGVCKHLEMHQCVELQKEAFALIHKYMTAGYLFSIDNKFQHLIPRFKQYENIYTFLCWQSILAVRHWANEHIFIGGIEYYFEAGHKSQKEFNRIMNELINNEYPREAYRYHSHTFVEKKQNLESGGRLLLQCADILAWHHNTNLKRTLLHKRPSRQDYNALVYNDKHFIAHYDESKIKAFAQKIEDKNREPNLVPHDYYHLQWIKGKLRLY